MLFNSVDFLLFFAAFIVLWPVLKRHNLTRWGYLTAASFFFYGWWDWRFIFLLLLSGLIDFFAALGMERSRGWRRPLLVLSLMGNLGVLAVFKYLDFGLANLNAVLDALGLDAAAPLPRLMLPVGISFYTFQSMSYTIDVYRGKLTPTRNPLHFFAYLAMFPQLVAGPIVRASQLLPQLRHAQPVTEEQRWTGLRLIVQGYFKKVVIADNLAPVVNAAFGDETLVASGLYWWAIALFFAVQIYCDFSGYSDIACGLARWMGYAFPENFAHPYIAGSFREFWTRWHISLSTWFRDYVYIPLGGSRRGEAAGHRNMWVTMLLSGLWHGAAWTFVMWGALHALMLSIERRTGWPERVRKLPGGQFLTMAVTLAGVLIGWVFFRAESMAQAVHVVVLMLSPATFELSPILGRIHWQEMLLVGLIAVRHVQFHPAITAIKWPQLGGDRVWQPAAVAVLVWACVILRGPGSAFIYFQF